MFNPNTTIKNIVSNPTTNALLSLIGRLLLVYLFIVSGWQKIGGYDGVVGYMESVGLPPALLPFTILLEVGGSIAVIVGFQTRLVAFFFAAFALISAFVFHTAPEDALNFMKNFSIGGGFIFLMLHGAGAWSLDGLTEKK
ncbi:DoxX family protein [Neisseria montereyensis]|uniref:DoxX family protein n=1 Tax=Neisseria montereyensis TaxID=2973938 RepID=A0ABT2FGT8_9NEIS|nr:DoxX family protein [Neisseria montereyensis]MCS4534540.1 DoxX family protein [Neisseria montereyensis]